MWNTKHDNEEHSYDYENEKMMKKKRKNLISPHDPNLKQIHFQLNQKLKHYDNHLE